jgi:hypothetical protein
LRAWCGPWSCTLWRAWHHLCAGACRRGIHFLEVASVHFLVRLLMALVHLAVLFPVIAVEIAPLVLVRRVHSVTLFVVALMDRLVRVLRCWFGLLGVAALFLWLGLFL